MSLEVLSTVFVSGDQGYPTFRIPAVLAASEGALLAFVEGRRDGAGDSGAIDLLVKSSTDRGRSWGAPRLVCSGHGDTTGNPTPAYDATRDQVVVLTTSNGGGVDEHAILSGTVDPADQRRVWCHISADGGHTWTRPREITDQVKRPDWRWYATGPGHATVLRHGPYAGRIVVPANHSRAPVAEEPLGPEVYGGHLLVSDDGGTSWRIGAVHSTTDGWINANETTLTELPDGRIYCNTRNQHGNAPGTRAHSWSSDGGWSWDAPYTPVPELRGPVCQGSVIAVGDRLVYAGPSAPGERARMSLRLSHDHGHSWERETVVGSDPAAYSDLVALDGSTVGVLYETGTRQPYASIRFAAIPVT